ncbi:MAG: hypothetical protein DRI90_23420 [Deltaproteobacteria bacterium]|nr:MAG: hypothetical protein DRI90_23420 [Deltaproteobacteria bacterium]
MLCAAAEIADAPLKKDKDEVRPQVDDVGIRQRPRAADHGDSRRAAQQPGCRPGRNGRRRSGCHSGPRRRRGADPRGDGKGGATATPRSLGRHGDRRGAQAASPAQTG